MSRPYLGTAHKDNYRTLYGPRAETAEDRGKRTQWWGRNDFTTTRYVPDRIRLSRDVCTHSLFAPLGAGGESGIQLAGNAQTRMNKGDRGLKPDFTAR